MTSSLQATITDRVDELLHAHRRTRTSLAVILELSQPAVSDRFRGRTPWTVADLERIAEALDADAADLLRGVA